MPQAQRRSRAAKACSVQKTLATCKQCQGQKLLLQVCFNQDVHRFSRYRSFKASRVANFKASRVANFDTYWCGPNKNTKNVKNKTTFKSLLDVYNAFISISLALPPPPIKCPSINALSMKNIVETMRRPYDCVFCLRNSLNNHNWSLYGWLWAT